jgi:hypothetical protein
MPQYCERRFHARLTLARVFACLNLFALAGIGGWVATHTSPSGAGGNTRPALLSRERGSDGDGTHPLDRVEWPSSIDRGGGGGGGNGGNGGGGGGNAGTANPPPRSARKRNRLIELDEDGDYDAMLENRLSGGGGSNNKGNKGTREREGAQWCKVRKRLRQVLQAAPTNWNVRARRLTCGSEDLECDCTWASKRLCHVKNNDGSLCFATCCCEVACDTQVKKTIAATGPWCDGGTSGAEDSKNDDNDDNDDEEEEHDDTGADTTVPELRLRPSIHDIVTQQIESTARMSQGCECDWVQEENCDPRLNDATPCFSACCNLFHAQTHILRVEQFLSDVVMPSGVLLDVKAAPDATAMASVIAAVSKAASNPALSVGVGRGHHSHLLAFPSTELLPPWQRNTEATRAEYLFRDIYDMGPQNFGAKTSSRPISELLCRKGTLPQLCPVGGGGNDRSTIILKCISCALSWYTIMVSQGLHSWHHVLMHKRDDDYDGGKLELLESVSSNAVQRKMKHTRDNGGGSDGENIDNNKQLPTHQLVDLGVPWACDLKKLTNFLKDGLPDRSAAMAPDLVDIRFIITNFGMCGEGNAPSHKSIHDAIRLHAGHKLDHFKIVDRPDEQFQRAAACNILHDVARDESVLMVIDVDMRLGTPYFARSLAFAVRGSSVYFPVVWSRFNPANVRKVARLRGTDVENVNVVGSPHSGKWRVWGKGNYAIYGTDAKTLRMDDNIVGWGGEDDDFFSRASRVVNVIRMREPHLVHEWHPKDCTHAKGKRKISCLGSLAEYEGSSLALVHEKLAEDRKKTELLINGVS